ncbi:MAG: DUF362 domain-containing protein [Bacillota bacterium]
MNLNNKKKLILVMLFAMAAAGFLLKIHRGRAEDLVRLPESTVAVLQAEKSEAADLTYEDIRDMVRQAVKMAGGFEGLVKDGQTVVVKPNLVGIQGYNGEPYGAEVSGVTTDWRISKAVVELVREYNPHGKVYILEGSAMSTREAMQELNYTPEYIPGADEFIALEEDSAKEGQTVTVKLPGGLLHKEYYLNKKYKEADVLISLPCLKNHWHATVTGGIKNVGIGATLRNIYPDRGKMVDHLTTDLHKWIRDFYLCRPVDFVIMDGLQGIQNGPSPQAELVPCQMNMRLILAGRDAVAVDTIEALIMEWDPESVDYLRFLNKDSAGNLDTACIKVVGKRVDEVRQPFEGVEPPAGGYEIETENAPKFKIAKQEVKDGVLLVAAEAGKDIHKIEVYVDGILKPPYILSGFGSLSLALGDLKKGDHEIRLEVYDRFLNRREAVIKVTI